jgi:hypothetical protein
MALGSHGPRTELALPESARTIHDWLVPLAGQDPNKNPTAGREGAESKTLAPLPQIIGFASPNRE